MTEASTKAKERKLTGRLRPAILRRDEYKCQVCGNTDDRLEVHHIKAVCNGGKTEEDNLITLCGFCHERAPESGKEEFDKYRKDRDGYILQDIKKHTDVWNKLNDAVLIYSMEKALEYLNAGIITREQFSAILKHDSKTSIA